MVPPVELLFATPCLARALMLARRETTRRLGILPNDTERSIGRQGARSDKGTDYRALACGRGEQPSRRHSHNRAGLEGKIVGSGRKNREAIQKYRHSPIRPAVRRRLPLRQDRGPKFKSFVRSSTLSCALSAQ